MRRDTPLVVTAVTQGLTSALALGFHLVVRPGVLQEYERSGLDLSLLSKWFLTTPLLPSLAAAGLVITAVAVGSPTSRGKKLRLLGATIVVTGAAFIVAALSSLGPLL